MANEGVKVSDLEEQTSFDETENGGCFYYVNSGGESRKITLRGIKEIIG